MDFIGTAHGVILNDPQLRQSLIRDPEYLRASPPRRERKFLFRHRLALALHGVASRIDPAIRTPELLLSSDAAGQRLIAVGEQP
jgi:hypothetical protein